MKTFFSKDSSYGDATDLVIVDTSDWTDEDWDEVDSGSDIYGNALRMVEKKRSLGHVVTVTEVTA